MTIVCEDCANGPVECAITIRQLATATTTTTRLLEEASDDPHAHCWLSNAGYGLRAVRRHVGGPALGSGYVTTLVGPGGEVVYEV